MLFEILMMPFWLLLNFIIDMIPSLSYSFNMNPEAFRLFLKNLSYGLYFFDSTLFALIIGNIVFWLTVQFTWAIIEWIYIKLPGVN
jgi:hypothetical protein